MRAMVLQPFYFPWIGMFDMLDQCDMLIFYDDAQFVKQSWQYRNRIKTYSGVKWLSVSLDRNFKLGTPIRAIKVNHDCGWVDKHLSQIKEAYHKADFFDEYYPKISSFLTSGFDHLIEYSAGSVKLAAALLGIKKRFAYSSSLNITQGRGTQKLIDICKAFGVDEYLDGASGRQLYNPDFFLGQGIKIYFHEYKHPVYKQQFGEFKSHLSVLDILFNEGPNSLSIIRNR